MIEAGIKIDNLDYLVENIIVPEIMANPRYFDIWAVRLIRNLATELGLEIKMIEL